MGVAAARGTQKETRTWTRGIGLITLLAEQPRINKSVVRRLRTAGEKRTRKPYN